MPNKQWIFTTLSDYLICVDNLDIGTFVYRRVSNEDYIKDGQIEASTCRRLKNREPYAWLSESEKEQFLKVERPKQLLNINEEMIRAAHSRGYNYKDGIHLSDLDLLAELQHYGAATCLIDFSYDATVALWFPCQPSSEKYSCIKQAKDNESEVTCQLISEKNANDKVVAVDLHHSHKVDDTEDQNAINYFYSPDEKGNYLLYNWQPKNQNNRIIAQRSIFIFGSYPVEAVAECVIPKEKKLDILYSLEKTLGITEESLFPDFDGFVAQRAHDKEYIGADVSGYIDHSDKALQNCDFEEVIRLCTKGISLQPDNIDVGFLLIRKAEAHNNKGEQDNAIEDCNKVIKLHESNYMPYHLRTCLNLRARIYESRNEHHSALQDYSKIIEVYSKDAEAYYNLGRVKKHLNRTAEAKVDFEKALELANQKDNMQVLNKEELIKKITKELDDIV